MRNILVSVLLMVLSNDILFKISIDGWTEIKSLKTDVHIVKYVCYNPKGRNPQKRNRKFRTTFLKLCATKSFLGRRETQADLKEG